MNQSLVPGELYRLRFAARVASDDDIIRPVYIEIAFNDEIIEPWGQTSWIPSNVTQFFPARWITDDGQWQFYDETFAAPNAGEDLDIFMIGTNGSDAGIIYGPGVVYCIIDDIRLEHVDNRTLNFPASICSPVNWTNLMNFVSTATTNGEFSINGVGLGEGVNQWATSTAGTYNISFSYIDEFHTCQTIEDVVIVRQKPDISFTISNSPVCVGQAVTLTASNAAGGPPVTYTWAPTSVTNPDSGPVVSATFQGLVTSVTLTGTNGFCSDTYTVPVWTSNCPPPVINATVTNPNCYGACNGSIYITASNPFSVTWSTGLNTNIPVISGLCAGTYTATINMPGFAITTFTYVLTNPAVIGTLYNGNLPPIPAGDPVDWPNNFNVTCDQDIIINAGATLNLTNGTNNIIKFTPGHGIIIMPGGHLHANHTTFTSTCGGWWKGISCQASSATVRGYVQLNNGCVVEKAIHGIMNHDGNNQNIGGRIACLNMTFKNNDRDIELQGFYSSTTDYGGVFRECIFEITAPGFTPQDITEKARVWMYDVGMVYFQGCKFRNLDSTPPYMLNTYHMKAIRAFKSEIYVNDIMSGFGMVQSEIKGFDLGIELIAPTTPCAIYNTDFQCYRGIFCSEMDGSRIYGNSFNNISGSIFNGDPTTDAQDGNLNGIGGNEDGSYAVYMRIGNKNRIDANTVSMTQDNNRYGFAFYNNWGSNRLYDNTMTNMTRGVVAWGQNKQLASINSPGLQIHCNTFAQIPNVISRNITVDALGSTSFLVGVQPIQRNGSSLNILSAGNNFSPSDDFCDDIFDNSSFGMEYYYHPSDNLDENEVCISVDPFGNGSGPNLTSFYTCPPSTAPAGMSPEEVLSGFNAIKTATATSLNTKRTEYNDLLDDSETENTLAAVEYATWQNVVDLYDELLSISPALSTEVMIRAIENENNIPAVILTAILAANPVAAKDEHVRRALDGRMFPLSEVQRAMIDLGITLTSAREELEWQMEQLKADYFMAKSEAILTLIERGEGAENWEVSEAIRAILNDDIMPEERYERVEYLIGSGEYYTAINLLDALPNDYSLRGLQTKEYEFLYPMFEILIALANVDSLDQSQIDLLEAMKDSEFAEVRRMAWGILEAERIYLTQDILYPEGYLEPRSLRVKRPVLSEEPSLLLYPNPANDLCIIKLSLSVESGKIVVLDAIGKVILEQTVPKFQTETFISVGDLAAGLYQVQLLNGNSSIAARASLIKQ